MPVNFQNSQDIANWLDKQNNSLRARYDLDYREFFNDLNRAIAHIPSCDWTLSNVLRCIKALQGLNNKEDKVSNILSALAFKLGTAREQERAREIDYVNAIYGLHNMSAEDPNVRYILDTIRTKMVANKISLSANNLARCFYSLQSMSYGSNEVSEFLKFLSDKLKDRNLVLTLQMISDAFSGFKSMESDNPIVQDIISQFTQRIKDSREVFSGDDIGAILSGFQKMGVNDDTVKYFLKIVTNQILRSPATLSPEVISDAMLGLENMSSRVEEVRKLVNALADKINASPDKIPDEYLRNTFRGLKNLESNCEETLKMVKTLTNKLTDPNFNPQIQNDNTISLVATLYGLQKMDANNNDVQNALLKLAQKIKLSNGEIDAQAICEAIYGLQNMDSKQKAVLEIVDAIADKLVSAHLVFTARQASMAFYGMQNMSAESREITKLLRNLTYVVKASAFRVKLTGAQIAMILLGFKSMKDLDVVLKALAAIRLKIEESAEEFEFQSLGNSVYGLNKMSADSSEVAQTLGSLDKKFPADFSTEAQYSDWCQVFASYYTIALNSQSEIVFTPDRINLLFPNRPNKNEALSLEELLGLFIEDVKYNFTKENGYLDLHGLDHLTASILLNKGIRDPLELNGIIFGASSHSKAASIGKMEKVVKDYFASLGDEYNLTWRRGSVTINGLAPVRKNTQADAEKPLDKTINPSSNENKEIFEILCHKPKTETEGFNDEYEDFPPVPASLGRNLSQEEESNKKIEKIQIEEDYSLTEDLKDPTFGRTLSREESSTNPQQKTLEALKLQAPASNTSIDQGLTKSTINETGTSLSDLDFHMNAGNFNNTNQDNTWKTPIKTLKIDTTNKMSLDSHSTAQSTTDTPAKRKSLNLGATPFNIGSASDCQQSYPNSMGSASDNQQSYPNSNSRSFNRSNTFSHFNYSNNPNPYAFNQGYMTPVSAKQGQNLINYPQSPMTPSENYYYNPYSFSSYNNPNPAPINQFAYGASSQSNIRPCPKNPVEESPRTGVTNVGFFSSKITSGKEASHENVINPYQRS